MSKERELLKECYFRYDKPNAPIDNLMDRIAELLTQPEQTEQEPPMTARVSYQRGYAAAEHDLKREPLNDAAIMLLGKQNLCLEASAFKPFGFARAIEKEHGIGGE